jgi:exodeoxyribonuclease VII small subunit
MTEKQPEFESAFSRLEEILEKLNGGNVTLDDSLRLYEEANTLIITCNKRLTNAEQRVATLVKNRQGELSLNEEGQPELNPFPEQKQ